MSNVKSFPGVRPPEEKVNKDLVDLVKKIQDLAEDGSLDGIIAVAFTKNNIIDIVGLYGVNSFFALGAVESLSHNLKMRQLEVDGK